MDKLQQAFKMLNALDPDRVTKDDFLAAYKSVLDYVKQIDDRNSKQFNALTDTLQKFASLLHESNDRYLNSISDGIDGADGKDGKDGKDGVSPDPEEVAKRAAELIKLPEYRAPIMDGPDELRNKLELLEGSERIKASAIDGLEQIIADIQTLKAKPDLSTMTPMGPVLYVGNAKKGRANTLNLVAGANVTLSHSFANGRNDVTITSTGGSGGGFTTLAATETPNGTITTFTFSSASAQPSYLVVDNVWMKATTAAGNTNWTWNNSTKKATLTVAPSDDIWAVV